MNEPLHFKGYDSSADFDRARFQLATPFQYLDIALDVAASNMQVEIAGDFLYCDTAFDGVVTIELNTQQDAPLAPFQIKAGFAMQALFKKLKVSWNAQPGKKIRILYSTGERIIPALTGNLTISGTIATLEDGMSYGASFKSVAALAVNSVETIVSPAANLNGMILHASSFLTVTGVGAVNNGSILAKTSAPTSLVDGDAILSPVNTTYGADSQRYLCAQLIKPVKIAAGKGLYFFNDIVQVAGNRNALYTLL